MTLYHTKHGGAIERNHNKLAEMNDNKGLPTVEEAIAEIRTKPVVPPWPTVGVVLGLSRGATYAADCIRADNPRRDSRRDSVACRLAILRVHWSGRGSVGISARSIFAVVWAEVRRAHCRRPDFSLNTPAVRYFIGMDT